MNPMRFAVCVAVSVSIFVAQVTQAQTFLGGAFDLDKIILGHGEKKGFKVVDASALIRSRSADALPGAPGRVGPPVQSAPPAKPPVAVDLCYLVDVTGSMKPHIDAIKDQIRGTVKSLTRDLGAVSALRLCFVGYRDFKDAKQVEILPLTSNIDEFLAFVERIQATGGGDRPEDVFGGLEAIGRQSWSSARRVVLHMGDQPCHGTGCGGGTSDPSGRTADEVFRPIRADKVKYTFGRISSLTDEMMQLFSDAYGQELNVVDVAPLRPPPPVTFPPSPDGRPGAPAPIPAPIPESVQKGVLKRKVGEASIAAVLLGISK